MADKKITALTELTAPEASDLLAIVDDPSGTPITKKATIEDVVTTISETTATANAIVQADSDGKIDDDWLKVSQQNDNLLINGDFQVSQDGASVSMASGTYFPDMFYFRTFTGTPTGTMSIQDFTPGQTDVPGEPEKYFRFYVTVNGGGSASLQYRGLVEDVRTLAGQTATISFYAKSDTARTMGLYTRQNFGSGGSSDVVTTVESSISVTTGWQKFEYTFTVPSISGKTIGAGSYLAVQLVFSDEVQTTDIARLKLEPGSVATESEIPPFGDVLRKCLRYYEKSYPYGIAPGTAAVFNGVEQAIVPSNTIANGQRYGTIRYSIQKRATPTVAIYGYGGTSGVIAADTGIDLTAGSGNVESNSVDAFIIKNATGGTLSTSFNSILYHWIADARL